MHKKEKEKTEKQLEKKNKKGTKKETKTEMFQKEVVIYIVCITKRTKERKNKRKKGKTNFEFRLDYEQVNNIVFFGST